MGSLSLYHKLMLALLLAVLLSLAAMGAGTLWLSDARHGWALAALVGPTSALLAFAYLARNLFQRLESLRTGLLNLLDGEFSVSLHSDHNDELGSLVPLFNSVSEKLRGERLTLYQRELMLDTVIQNSGLYLLLCDARGRIVYHSRNLADFCGRGSSLLGAYQDEFLAAAPSGLHELFNHKRDGMFDARRDGEARIYHLSVGRFVLNAAEHHLYLIKDMTREITRQEAQVWKKAIRVISHELNNTLAPISSMSHSSKVLLEKRRYAQLPAVLDTISERCHQLRMFIERYAEVARLPAPAKRAVTWQQLLQPVTGTYPFTIIGTLPDTPLDVDPSQIQQVLINLLKNAVESGSPAADIKLQITLQAGRHCLRVFDRGGGMPSDVLLDALHPYFSTKDGGSGIGLPLSREIIEAHGGSFAIANRPEGGLVVRVEL